MENDSGYKIALFALVSIGLIILALAANKTWFV